MTRLRYGYNASLLRGKTVDFSFLITTLKLDTLIDRVSFSYSYFEMQFPLKLSFNLEDGISLSNRQSKRTVQLSANATHISKGNNIISLSKLIETRFLRASK